MASLGRMSAEEVERVLVGSSAGQMKEALASLVELVKAQSDSAITATTFMTQVESGTRCLDVRSPGEFAKGHIPGAVNVPLFDDEERAVVGTRYKNHGRDSAVQVGMTAVAKKGLDRFTEAAGHEDVCVYCWRGGLRSGAVAWLLRRRCSKNNVAVLQGGYKAFRNWARETWSAPSPPEKKLQEDDYFPMEECRDTGLGKNMVENDVATSARDTNLVVIGGRTGVGKTRVLKALEAMGEQVIDLEGLAVHRGSAFGFVSTQPSNEHFENMLAIQWRRLDLSKPIWIEDEEGHVGKCCVPTGLYELMRTAKKVVRISAPIPLRVAILVDDYATEDPAKFVTRLLETTDRLQKRLGGDNAKVARRYANDRNFHKFAELMLTLYYDKLYDKHIALRNHQACTILDIDASSDDTNDDDTLIFDAHATANAAKHALLLGTASSLT